MAKEKQKRDKGNFLALQRSRFIVLALVALIEIIFLSGFSLNLLLGFGDARWLPEEIVMFTAFGFGSIALLLWASYRTYRHFWKDAIVPKPAENEI
jgi:hypothetical protein